MVVKDNETDIKVAPYLCVCEQCQQDIFAVLTGVSSNAKGPQEAQKDSSVRHGFGYIISYSPTETTTHEKILDVFQQTGFTTRHINQWSRRSVTAPTTTVVNPTLRDAHTRNSVGLASGSAASRCHQAALSHEHTIPLRREG